MFTPQGSRLDADGSLGTRMRDAPYNRGVDELPQVARLSDVTFPSDTLFPGRFEENFPLK